MSRGFRVWDMVSECYLPVSRGGNDGVLGITTDGTGIIYVEDGEVNVHLAGASSVIIEQYTGIKDKNGKEIYEGDIVTLIGEWEEVEKDDCNVVTFRDGCFRVGDGYEDEAGSYLSDWRVIGNIHENPELIGGEDDN